MVRRLTVTLFLCSSVASALTPPWNEEELKKAADLVVEGEIGGPLRCLGLIKQYPHAEVYRYQVLLRVQKIHKGTETVKKGETVPLSFYHTFYKPGAVGDQETGHLPGQKGKYYLKRMEDGGWHQVHWSGVQVFQEGGGALKKCP